MIEVRCELTNPGQFFACCGLLELADRLWGAVEGWFEGSAFRIGTERGLADLVSGIATVPLRPLDLEDDTASAMELGCPAPLRLDWWMDGAAGQKNLKTWAGRMSGVRIARAMQAQLGRSEFHDPDFLDRGEVVYDPAEPDKKVEPYYFDARRGSCAHPLDVGFAPDPLGMTSLAYPAVEFLCLVGLQRFRPLEMDRRVFDYYTWCVPLAPAVAAGVACGMAPAGGEGYRFENGFRTDQRKHKGFISASVI